MWTIWHYYIQFRNLRFHEEQHDGYFSSWNMISLWYVNQEYVTWWQMHYHECQTSQNKKEYQIKQLLSNNYYFLQLVWLQNIFECLSTKIFFSIIQSKAKEKANLESFMFFFGIGTIISLRSRPKFEELPCEFKNTHYITRNA